MCHMLIGLLSGMQPRDIHTQQPAATENGAGAKPGRKKRRIKESVGGRMAEGRED